MACGVAQRVPEIGLRLAFGARPPGVAALLVLVAAAALAGYLPRSGPSGWIPMRALRAE